jgi:hypothetical protein
MNIGIVGSGNMGSALGKIWASKGHKVVFSYSRTLEKLQAAATAAGANASTGSPMEAAQFADVIFLGVAPNVLEDALQAAGSLADKVVISCVSGLKPDWSGQTMGLPTDLTISVAEQIAQLAPGAKVVEAFNTTFAEILQSESREFGSDRPSIFYCGDDRDAKVIAASLIEDCGYEAVDAGGLRVARSLESLATIWVQMALVSEMFPNIALKVLRH